MITLRFYRASTTAPNREMKGAFTKTFDSIDEAAKYLNAIRKSDVWVDGKSYRALGKQTMINLNRKFQALAWGKCIT